MPKKVEDIVKSNKRSVRDIPTKKDIPSRGKAEKDDSKSTKNIKIHRDYTSEDIDERDVEDEIESKPKKTNVIDKKVRSKKGKGKFKVAYTFFIAVIVVATLGYFISLKFAKAVFDVYKREVPVIVSGTYIGKTENTSTTSIQYRISTLSDSVSIEVDATEKDTNETYASGQVTLVNSYNMTGQKLLAGTRISDDLVHIYRLTSTVTVPGYSKKNGQIIPGKIIARVTADKTGSEYNVNLDQKTSEAIYKIVAYKGTDKYINIYAKLYTSIVGGSKGKEKVIEKSVLDKNLAVLKKMAYDKINTKVSLLFSKDSLVLSNGGIVYDFQKNTISSNASTSPNKAILTLPYSAKILVFDKAVFIKKIASEKATQSFEPFSFEAIGLDKLIMTVINEKDLLKDTKKDIAFKISGQISLMAIIPESALKKDLAGQKFDNVTNIIAKYKNILGTGSAVQLVPPWATVIPSDEKKITINIK